MKAPDIIYLQVCGDCPGHDCKNCKFEDLEDNVTWCKDRIFQRDKEYISKETLMEWLLLAKEETTIGICEYDKGEENGRMDVIYFLTNQINSL